MQQQEQLMQQQQQQHETPPRQPMLQTPQRPQQSMQPQSALMLRRRSLMHTPQRPTPHTTGKAGHLQQMAAQISTPPRHPTPSRPAAARSLTHLTKQIGSQFGAHNNDGVHNDGVPLTPQQVDEEKKVIKAAVGWFRVMNGLDDDQKAELLKNNFGGDAQAAFLAQATPTGSSRRLPGS
jgi:hypothetical protein